MIWDRICCASSRVVFAVWSSRGRWLTSRSITKAAIRFEKLDRLLHQMAILRNYPEAAAVVDVQPSEVERQYKQLAPINDHHLAVIAEQIVRCGGYRHSLGKQPRLEFAQVLLAAAIRIGD